VFVFSQDIVVMCQAIEKVFVQKLAGMPAEVMSYERKNSFACKPILFVLKLYVLVQVLLRLGVTQQMT